MIGAYDVQQYCVIDTDCESVWNAWTDPEQMKHWLCPMGMVVAEVEADLKIGGRYRVVMEQGSQRIPTPPEFGDSLVVEGAYEKIEEPNVLEFTWQWKGRDEASLVHVSIQPEGAGTRVELVHTLLKSESDVKFHRIGWIATFENLRQLFVA